MEQASVATEQQAVEEIVDALRRNLRTAKTLRARANTDAWSARQRLLLREWQAARLARSHAELLASARYGEAARFFLADLYGPKDFSSRDEEVERILPLLIKLLPASALRALALAVELDALTEELDAAMVAELCRAGLIEQIDDQAYASAYRAVGFRCARERQVVLIRTTGEALDTVARKPLLSSMLHLMRRPAQLAGLGDLHSFLDRGFHAFRRMGSATEFLASIERKEQKLLHNLFAGDADPFAP